MVAKVDRRTWVCILWVRLGVQLMMKPILTCAKLAFNGHYIASKQAQTLMLVILKTFEPVVLILKAWIKIFSLLYSVHQSSEMSLNQIRMSVKKSGKPVLKANNGLALWSIKSSQSMIMRGLDISTKDKPNSLLGKRFKCLAIAMNSSTTSTMQTLAQRTKVSVKKCLLVSSGLSRRKYSDQWPLSLSPIRMWVMRSGRPVFKVSNGLAL